MNAKGEETDYELKNSKKNQNQTQEKRRIKENYKNLEFA